MSLVKNLFLFAQVHAVVGVLGDDTDPMVTVMKLDKAPQETYADIGGLDTQIQEIKESVELPLTHPEYYEEMGIKPPKGVILYGPPGTGRYLIFSFFFFNRILLITCDIAKIISIPLGIL